MKWLIRLLGLQTNKDERAQPVELAATPTGSEKLAAQERRSDPDPVALKAVNKPVNHRPGLDLEKLKSLPSAQYQPLTEYLSYIQVKRGEAESLVFVRASDIDALAKMTGESRDNFVKEFKRLGVLISMN
ncbi:MAG: hypothetical protein ACT4OM_04210 [Actinomycetota bacterium]